MPSEDRHDRWNYGILLSQGTSSSSGSQLTSERLVLPFLYSTLGAPIFFAGLLVPIATVTKLIVQVFAAPLIRAARGSRWINAGSALVWALSLILVATAISGTPVSLVIPIFVLVTLIVGAARGLNSLAAQDFVGQALVHHRRSKLLFTQAALSGLFAIAVALASQFILPPETANGAHEELIWLGIALIALSALLALAVREPAEAPKTIRKAGGDNKKRPIEDLRNSFRTAFALSWFRQFLVARSLFLSVELSTPFFAVHAASFHADNPLGLTTFVIGSSLGQVAGGLVWPRVFRGSMRLVLAVGVAIACLGGLLAIAHELAITPQSIYVYGVVFVLLGLGGQAIRSGRTLYLMNVCTDAQRPVCIAVSNVIIGFASIVFGAVLGALAGLQGVAWPIVVLIVLNVVAVAFALKLKAVKPA